MAVERFYRTQILLSPDQHRRLREIAQREKRSIAAVSRDLLEYALRERERSLESRLQRVYTAHEVAERLLQERGGQPIDVDVVDLLHEARRERENALGN
ncbi:MAG: hypothetical protein RMK65_04650 [Anaerolineae bacterium]|nr:hypothetical protein [Anaerolineae bacterium]MDW7991426.1 hypothetical protein [Anaerolineae bacterium]